MRAGKLYLVVVLAVAFWLAMRSLVTPSNHKPPCVRRARVAVCFYGLNRSLRHTIESLRSHIFGPLDAACVQADVFFHTWTVRDEAGVPLGGAQELLELLGDRVVRWSDDDQDAFDQSVNFSAWRQVDDRYKGPNFKNIRRQLESLARVTALWKGHADYAAVLCIRPDLLVLDDIDVEQLIHLEPNQLLTPYWHRYSGLNDRLGAGRVEVAAAFGTRARLMWDYAQSNFIRAESFLSWAMLRHHGFGTAVMTMRAQRTRVTGKVADNDICLRWCAPRVKKCKGDCRTIIPDGQYVPPRPDWAVKQQQRDLESGRLDAPRHPVVALRQH